MALARISHIVFALAVCALLCLQVVAAQGTMETDSNGLPLPPDAAGAAVQPWLFEVFMLSVPVLLLCVVSLRGEDWQYLMRRCLWVVAGEGVFFFIFCLHCTRIF
ncbi:hypothetical protein DQ04_00791010 [Trypanosoma grayi]|uniref:hypothetical protein n=1 Tax=Trypanosoma grayi TaxID=71804 RepID=UPI0004F4AC52|nr:hypothetical protein DQ04_00791010 [Trypanosoma grayi]KEG13771.1 hypothetical protein DQ04_00791010 [Trypanosoma grayi]